MTTRRRFLRLLGLAPAAAVVPQLPEPESPPTPTRTTIVNINSEHELDKLLRGGAPALRRFLLESRDRISL